MPFNGAGVYSPPGADFPAVANTLIESTKFNSVINDIATALSAAILKDGTQTVTANIPFGNNRLLTVGAGLVRTDAVNLGQLQDASTNWVAAGGTADAITATYSPAITALVDGQLAFFRATAANATTTPTFAPNGLTARTITKRGGTAVIAGDIPGNLTEVILRYNLANTRWELLNPASAAVLSAQQGFSMINGTFVASQNGSIMTLALKTFGGGDPAPGDPVYVMFRNPTAATGDYTLLPVVAATSITTTVAGTFGAANSVPFRLWIAGFNDASTFRLALINCLTTAAGAGTGRDATQLYPLGQFPIASATQIGAGSTSAGVFYSFGAAVASKAYAVLGYLAYESGLATAGTFNVNQTRLHLQKQNDPLPGAVLQYTEVQSGAMATGTTVLPVDDTIPQNTEGDQFLAAPPLTSTSAANVLEIEHVGNYSSNSATYISVALFQDAVANALSVVAQERVNTTRLLQLNLTQRILAGVTTAVAIKARAGGDSAGTITFNGSAGARLFGGVAGSSLVVKEILA